MGSFIVPFDSGRVFFVVKRKAGFCKCSVDAETEGRSAELWLRTRTYELNRRVRYILVTISLGSSTNSANSVYVISEVRTVCGGASPLLCPYL